jgi:hypothetical protein
MDKPPIAPSSRAAGQIKIDLGVETKRAWMQWCADRGLVPNKALRSLVDRALTDGLELATSRSGEVVRVVVAKQPDRGAKVGREVYFTPSENAAIEAVAKAQGFAFQEWVVAAVRAALAKAPSYGQAELEALTQSNAHMAQVAVDLAALRRQEGAGEIAEKFGQLEGEIRQHVETVSAAMAQGAQRWQISVK